MATVDRAGQGAAREADGWLRAGDPLDGFRSESWRTRLFDRLSASGAMLLGVLLLFSASDLAFGANRLRDVLIVVVPLAMLATAAWSRAPFRLRVFTFIGCLLALELLAVIGRGYAVGTILLALLAVGLAGLFLGRRSAVASWVLSTAILFGAGIGIQQGWILSSFEPALVDPRDFKVALGMTLSYAVFSAILAVGVFLVVDRLQMSLFQTRAALREATTARSAHARAEDEKTALEAQFHSLVEHAPDSIAIVDRDRRVLFANHQRDGGRLTPNPIGQQAEDLVAPDHARRVRDAVDSVFENGEPVSYEVQVEINERGRVWYSSRVGPVLDESGKVDRAIVVSSDISGRLELEEQLLQAQKLEAVGQLTGGVAHDFNNLLTVILGNLHLVGSTLPEEDGSQRFVENARAAAKRGAALTHRLLAFARKQALQPRVLDVSALIAGMDDLLRRTLGETIRVELRLDPDLWRCEVDPTQLENVVLNLAINARDAMPTGGELTLETANVELDEEEVRHFEGLEPGRYVKVSIADSGAGMDREILDRAFEPFFTTKGAGEGSGLGLSMVYGFVKQSGGDVALESSLGEGTCVCVYLPRVGEAVAVPVAVPEVPTPVRWPRGEGELVLVVEDDADVRSLTRTLLERIGYQTVEAEDGEHALAMLERHPVPEVQLVFTDVVLPGRISGAELAETIHKTWPDLPVLFTSGYTRDALGAHGRLPPNAQLLEKPFAHTDLAERIRALLGVDERSA